MKAIQVAAQRLKCDSCDYVSGDIKVVGPELINVGCPQCGKILLTREDYDAGQAMTRKIESLNDLVAPLLDSLPITVIGLPHKASLVASRGCIEVKMGEWPEPTYRQHS